MTELDVVTAPPLRLTVRALDVILQLWCRACGVYIATEGGCCAICDANRRYAQGGTP